ncbi:hypothetical protein HS7_09910 [Sulfolobales archaeon HS-7]|nr:hypothetical protein HS7_09910 [Sulfolobales archaeon HS-7]
MLLGIRGKKRIQNNDIGDVELPEDYLRNEYPYEYQAMKRMQRKDWFIIN